MYIVTFAVWQEKMVLVLQDLGLCATEQLYVVLAIKS